MSKPRLYRLTPRTAVDLDSVRMVQELTRESYLELGYGIFFKGLDGAIWVKHFTTEREADAAYEAFLTAWQGDESDCEALDV